jgi:signal transduction histidine kinase
MQLFPERHALHRLVPMIVNRASVAGRARGVVISARVDADAGDLETDPQKLEQALNLLIDNAATYGGEREVIVSARSTTLASGEAGVALTVADRGPGIDATLLPTLFDTFSEGQDIQHAQKGPGLGLPLARRICRLMGGDLQVERTGAQGTLMRIELPRSTAAAALAA